MTINELLEHTMTRDPNNSNIVHFDGSKLEPQDEEEGSVCIHCILDAQADKIDNLEADIWDLKSQIRNLLKAQALRDLKGSK